MTQSSIGYYSVEPHRARPPTRHGGVSLWLLAAFVVLAVVMNVWNLYGIPIPIHIGLFSLACLCALAGTVTGFLGLFSPRRRWMAIVGFVLHTIMLLWIGLAVVMAYVIPAIG